MNFDIGSRMDEPMLETLYQLIQANVDSAQGFQEAAADVDDPELARLFRQWSAERFIEADRLRACVKRDDRPLLTASTWLDGWRRIWLSVRGALNVRDRAAMIRGLERAEACVCRNVEQMLAESRDPMLIDALGQQLHRAQAITDALRGFRNGRAAIPVRKAGAWTGSIIENTVASAAANPAEVA